MNIVRLILWVIPVAVSGCIDQRKDEALQPPWVEQLIAQYAAAPLANPPRSIWRCAYQGKTVYFVPAECCDQYSDLFDAEGRLIGHPDGGFTGTGDGHYGDFFQARKEVVLIWRDPRGGSTGG